ncbi:MAG: hypothetical protein KF774_12360 [Planctomyces sp.]|nr:hypothetical protein [Planctomyces sp.]
MTSPRRTTSGPIPGPRPDDRDCGGVRPGDEHRPTIPHPLLGACVLPVLDLLGGQVVHGIAGRRQNYRPVDSQLAPSARPSAIASAFRIRFGFREAYVADLDAIQGGPLQQGALVDIQRSGLDLWLDAGVRDARDVERLAGFRPARIILGLESLDHPNRLAEIARTADLERLVFSLDLRDGRAMTEGDGWPAEPLEIAAFAWSLGLRTMIVLDVAAVGVSGGLSTLPLCAAIRARHTDATLITGGGVRSAADLRNAAGSGVDRVLVASCLHEGSLTPEMLAAPLS